MRRAGLAALAVLLALLAAAAPAGAQAQSLPSLTGPVDDFAHVLDSASTQTLDQRIRSLQQATGDVVVVATVQTFAPYGSIEEYAARLFEHAGIGQKSKDNGVLVVLAVTERRVRIEVGYGLEEYITDGDAGDIIRQAMLPAFRQGQYGAGVLAGTTRVIQRIAQARGVTLSDVPAPTRSQDDDGGIPIGAVIAGIVILMALSNLFRRRGPGPPFRGGPWGGWYGGLGGFGGGFGGGGFRGGGFGGFGGGGGGGFGGFGGGRSGGGGASGGW
jgi:uncharacterized protein